MRNLDSNETEMVSGAGFRSSLGPTVMGSATPRSVGGNTGNPFDDMLAAVGAAFEKVASILNYYTNQFSVPSNKR
ncbi:hypothetical protein ED28_13710 [[Pantoea] beijingensis]|uniref:Uncharacterized protein n=1 Tax=[Pantoea] beijingensis TaxID=1324864 RepID=A0A443IBR3_9GAMM|nr:MULTISPECIES: hypothetical protein [Erwiniaceae]RWR01539.1 hypothetical protein ED28_13710 [[Pantoea] beijingensis]